MNRTSVVEMIDEALERYAARDRVTGSEIVDFLLDLRTVGQVVLSTQPRRGPNALPRAPP